MSIENATIWFEVGGFFWSFFPMEIVPDDDFEM